MTKSAMGMALESLCRPLAMLRTNLAAWTGIEGFCLSDIVATSRFRWRTETCTGDLVNRQRAAREKILGIADLESW